ncbi:hypothetical protein LTR99_003940 [Exophiala xenobiotica]|uniref:Amine oxidase domain-containing protein n=1 Tax=Vermiconidia calcicola TaxID=1690605 RepID=A0AAV9PX94_9PEZI|nr:hypothetical protein LTR99_003940 [Exophiala xenobiotica]KAK5529741.1 hypothetical protein LTR25_009520 [Vermiconidia calcicola]KAK5549054.1 hypothetical protein LTR23_000884 [Chaetothyriales sp. CCFEE 6169]KAK5435407.1 hypothetical protein LTR34_002911 [Exophiala xenobiotica]KAK5444710.1 hypothetical protein LTR18_004414 [Exophiala xenobiotica]
MQNALRHAATSTKSPSSIKKKMPHVAVIGAGVAGLRCSDVLARSGCHVTVFEARSRIGGRVHQVESGGHLVDMGPNWIHGTQGNPIMHLAEKTRTIVMEPEEAGGAALIDSDGQRRSDAEAVELSGKVWEMVVDAFKYSDENSASIDPQRSLYEYFREQLSTKDDDGIDHENDNDKRRQDLLHEAQMWGPFVGDSVETQSLKFFFLEECIEGENVFVADTYKNILNEIGKAVTSGGDKDNNVVLKLDTEVVHFDTTSSGSTSTSSTSNPNPILLQPVPGDGDGNGNGNRVTVTTSTGETHTFDEVVITCPLGWLKRNLTRAFTPPLPTRLSQAITHINYGRLEKLYVTFPSAFWLRDSDSDSDSDSSPKNNGNGNNKNNAVSTNQNNYPLFTHYHDPKYVSHPQDEAWNQSVMSLAHMPSPHAHPTLLFYVYGACGTHMVNAVQDLEQHSEQYNQVLTTFSEPYYSRLPTYRASDPACKPSSFLMTTWQADRFAGNGSYCNFQVGLERGDEDIQVMRAAGGLTSQGLWLAGEHTAPFIALGTTTGAWWSGEGVARRICDTYALAVPEDVAVPEDGESVGLKKQLDSENPDAANLNGLAI